MTPSSFMQTSQKSSKTQTQGSIVVITGPSGVGKGTVVKALLDTVPGLTRSVSVTTRAKRAEEVEGRDYFFRTEEEFQELRHSKELLEWAEFAGAHYGTPKFWVLEQLKKGLDVILEIEVQGAKQVRERFPSSLLVFLSPPSFEALETRLVTRATESPEKIALRLAKAKEEMKQKHLFHYEVINDNLEEAINNLIHIVYAERCRIRNPIA